MPYPSASDQKHFAARFERREWDYLCKDESFVIAVQQNLKRAWILSVRLLAEFYSIHTFARNEMEKLRQRLLKVGMTEAQISIHFANASNQSALRQMLSDEEDGEDFDLVEA